MVKAPWPEDFVKRLNAMQVIGTMHPYTCGGAGCRADLVATAAGWVCPKCSYTQDWALPLSQEMLDAAQETRDWLMSAKAKR